MNVKKMLFQRNKSSLLVASLMLFAFGCGGGEGEDDLDAPPCASTAMSSLRG